jgi:CheY-like chemotaxis protein
MGRPEIIGAEGSAPVQRRRLLVIDDEVRLVRSLQLLLRYAHDVTCATRAEEALAEVVAGVRFDLILCDLQMPGMSGMELAARLVEVDPGCRPRLVFLTGGAVTAEARAFLQSTEHKVLTKPVPVEQLLAEIEAVEPRID